MRGALILLVLSLPAAAETLPRGTRICDERILPSQCRPTAAPMPAHQSTLPGRIYLPFRDRPSETQERRPFER